MYIYPTSTIKLLRNVPLDPTYEHTIFFDNLSQQENYFNNYVYRTFDKQTYTRVNKGKLRILGNCTDYYNINYLMFQNERFINNQGQKPTRYPVNDNSGVAYYTNAKWFYAFVTSVEYVNEMTTEISFEIDVLQTWFFDYQLCECFVEREHTATDTLYGNLVEENLDIGDEYTINGSEEFDLSALNVIIFTLPKTSSEYPHGNEFKSIFNIMNPLHLASVDLSVDDLTLIRTALSNYTNDEIALVYECPAQLIPQRGSGSSADWTNVNPAVHTKQLEPPGAFGTYIPKNKKLFTAPYTQLLVSNGAGQTATYKWEDWAKAQDSNKYTFVITGTFTTIPVAICYPTHYKNIAQAHDYGITMSNFPQCCWVNDVFEAWWAQNKNSFVTGVLADIIGSASGMGRAAASGASQTQLEGAATTAALSAGISVAQAVAKVQDIKNAPPQLHGQTQTDSLNAGLRRFKYIFYKQTIKEEYAKIIDEYFTRYGYACKRNKVPNTNVRQRWTYTKTIGCTIKPKDTTHGLPGDDMAKICSIYNNGITFWDSAATIGDYTANNAPA